MSGVLWSTDSSVTIVTSPSERVLIIDVVVALIFTRYVDFGLLLKQAYSSYLRDNVLDYMRCGFYALLIECYFYGENINLV